MPTIADVARAAQVSKATASRVLGGRNEGLVTPATADRVREAARELGYRPNAVATALATGKTGAVALSVISVFRPFYAELMHHVADQARANGWDLIIAGQDCFASDGGPPELCGSQWPVDGILAFEPPCAAQGRPQEGWPDLPVVVLSASPFAGADAVRIDLYEGARAAVEHLVQQGCRHIGYVAPSYAHDDRSERPGAYHDVLSEKGLEAHPIVTCDDANWCAGGRQAVADYLADHGVPDGLFCHNDEIAIGAIRALKDQGLRVPEDVAVVGCDDISLCPFVDPPLSTIRIPIREIAVAASELLAQRIQDPSRPHRSLVFPTCFVARRSSSRAGRRDHREPRQPEEV